jgi:hypothetical protein
MHANRFFTLIKFGAIYFCTSQSSHWSLLDKDWDVYISLLFPGNLSGGRVGIINMANTNLHMAVIIAVRNIILHDVLTSSRFYKVIDRQLLFSYQYSNPRRGGIIVDALLKLLASTSHLPSAIPQLVEGLL